ncbi:MAG: threonine synthase, partial [Micavibrio aeruginosavorus]|nr:threonine synthase [Micavibrio aeruginosavorus]
MIRYISTRGPGEPKNFLDVMMAGLAPDGGLYIPDTWPELDHSLLSHLAGTPYTSVAASVIAPFVGKSFSGDVLQGLLAESYESGMFNHSAIAPLVQIGPNAWILELFHGPTLSFKDYAMQFLGRIFDMTLEKSGQKLTILGATSGDTGSAAIEALRHCRNITTIILHPKDRTSAVQRRQMTTVESPNVHNLAVEGTFDDCQALVKAVLSDTKLQQELRLSAVNSINWARIMAQVVYYVYAAVALGAPDRPVSFTVPTGNFGNVYSAWVARRMGIPIHRLTLATNRNDILTRFFETGEMRVDKVMPSLSPSMDIQVSSNFERYLCDLMHRDHTSL